MKLKEIVFIALLFFVIKGFDDLLSMHNYDFNCLFDPKTYTDEPLSVEHSVEVNDTVYIKGLGDFNQSDLLKSKEILEEKFGVICKIDGSVSTNKDFYTADGLSLEENKCFSILKSNKRVVYITNELLYSDIRNQKLKGGSLRSHPNIIVRTKTLKNTLYHEFGHLLGLRHCENKVCVMGVHNSKETNNDFCDKCSNKIKL